MWQPLRDIAPLAEAWRTAEPFPHVVVDDYTPAGDLMTALDDFGVNRYESDLFAFEATAPDALDPLAAGFAATLGPQLAQITGKRIRSADMRAYAYRPGHYLLPHTDHQDGLERVLAYAYYLPTPEPPRGGELELYRCTVTGGTLATIEPAHVIEPAPWRLAVFDVSAVSLHQVREVLAGLRLSLAGWFYP